MVFIIEQFPVQHIAYMRRTGAYGIENYKLMTALKECADSKGLLEDGIILQRLMLSAKKGRVASNKTCKNGHYLAFLYAFLLLRDMIKYEER